jgi:AcrR family transcriptional regulator
VSRREATKAANRQAILDAATEVFAELGYGAASVRDIVRRTDLASGTFYNYFPDKESVLRAVLADAAARIAGRVQAARHEAADLPGFVGDGFRAYYEVVAADRRLLHLLRRNAGTIRAMFEEPALLAVSEDLVADLRAGMAAGTLPAGLDPQYLAGAMVGAGFEVGVLMLERDPPDVEGAVAFVTALFLGGLEQLRRHPPGGKP